MSDPHLNQAEGPESALNMGTTAVGGPVDAEPDASDSSGPDDSPIDPDSGMPFAARKIP